MILNQPDPVAGGTLEDTFRRDILNASDGADVFLLNNDGRTDTVMGLQDGLDLIDLSVWEASVDQISIRQKSLTEYVIDYLGEERVQVTVLPPQTVPDTGVLLTADDLILATGLPEATVQLLREVRDDAKEVIFGTTLPDVFLFSADGQRDTVRRFEQGKDQIDLSSYGIDFSDLTVTERKVGRLSIAIPVGDPEDEIPPDHLVLIDLSRQITLEKLTEDDFIF